MKETREKRVKGKSVRFLAAAALSAALISGQVPVNIAADSGSAVIEMNELIPENITVDGVMMLADVKLPEIKHGKLKWVDDSIWLTERVQSCEVFFIPEDGFDISGLEGWDKADERLITHIKVIVSSIEETEAKNSGEEEVPEELPSDGGTAETPEITAAPTPGEDTADADRNTEKTAEGESEPDKKTEGSADAENESDEKKAGKPEEEEKDSGQKNDKVESSEEDSDKDSDIDSDKHADEAPDNDTEADLETETNSDDDNGSGEGTADTEYGEDIENSDETEDKPDNIFDNPLDADAEDERPMDAPEGLTEEEQLLRGQMNHQSDGISVSGINLPWYVQFRVTNGESYEFTNETDAVIFRSYEFELWDLQNNTEYEIPDGEYISVTVPVKEGYDYTIEHLLDNGAYETIIPSVEGNRLVFSTHSFSPFGIAGSKQLVGPDFPIDDVKPSVTPTPPAAGKPGENNGNNGSSTGNSNAGNTPETGAPNDADGGGTGTGSNGTGGGNGSNGNGGTGGSGDISNGNNGNTESSSNTGNNGNTGSNSNNGNNGDQTASSNNGSQSVNNGHAVRTGDTTPILPFVILILAAGVIIGAVIFFKRKNKQNPFDS